MERNNFKLSKYFKIAIKEQEASNILWVQNRHQLHGERISHKRMKREESSTQTSECREERERVTRKSEWREAKTSPTIEWRKNEEKTTHKCMNGEESIAHY